LTAYWSIESSSDAPVSLADIASSVVGYLPLIFLYLRLLFR
jgi:hypothetical protein